MKKFFFAVVLSCSGFVSQAHAVSVEFVLLGARSFARHQGELTQPRTVGSLAVELLNRSKIPFTGGDYGISKIRDRGGELEVLSDTQMRAYGWCYTVDGKLSDVMSDKFEIPAGSTAKIRWFYAYAFYDRGNWISYCTPADHLPAQE